MDDDNSILPPPKRTPWNKGKLIPSRSYKRAAVSHCGPLQRAWKSAAFLRRAAASGLRCKSADCWRRPAALSAQASPSRERRSGRAVRTGSPVVRPNLAVPR